LTFRAVAADTGAIGGSGSHEFHVLADSGEDAIAFCPGSDYAANVEMAEAMAPATVRSAPTQTLSKIATPGHHTVDEVAAALHVAADQVVKTLIVRGVASENAAKQGENRLVALLVRGDHQLNEIKAAKLAGVLNPLEFASEAEIRAALGCGIGSIGPVGLNLPMFADRAVVAMHDFTCGANEDGYHLSGVNFGRDLPEPVAVDIRNVVVGDASPDGAGDLDLCRGIEVGHIFKLGTKYSQALDAKFLDENGKSQVMVMGCYGIGVSRIVGAAIEQGNDDRGIVFPQSMAPFELAIVPLGLKRSEAVREAAEWLYKELMAAGVDVVLDDRDERPGVMFADMELIGVPHRVVVSDRGLKEGMLEYQARTDAAGTKIAQQSALAFILKQVETCRSIG
jgi:prolyl-tRNA synthetase